MKLRNKKTGEVVDTKDYNFKIATPADPLYEHDVFDVREEYNSLTELNAEWEDYKPAEPLIKNEKIRKAVRAWWETIPDAITDKRVLYKKNQDLAVGVYTIYCGAIYPETLETGKFYTIAELCGEEEE